MSIQSFKMGQRVLVLASGVYDSTVLSPAPIAGTVVRLRRADDGAWVKLDRRSEQPGIHPFPEDDDAGRGTHVCTFPDECLEAP